MEENKLPDGDGKRTESGEQPSVCSCGRIFPSTFANIARERVATVPPIPTSP